MNRLAMALCLLPLGPMATIVKHEYGAGRATCRHHLTVHRLRCTITTDTDLIDPDTGQRFPQSVSAWVRVDWRNGVLHGDLEPHTQGFDLAWLYPWPCRSA